MLFAVTTAKSVLFFIFTQVFLGIFLLLVRNGAWGKAAPAVNFFSTLISVVVDGCVLIILFSLVLRGGFAPVTFNLVRGNPLVVSFWGDVLPKNFSVSFEFAAGGLSVIFIFLAVFLINICILFYKNVNAAPSSTLAWCFILKGFASLAFMSSNLFSFLFFMEASALPMWFLFRDSTSKNKSWAALYYLWYSFCGGILVMIGALLLTASGYSISFANFGEFVLLTEGITNKPSDTSIKFYLFLILVGLLIKIPVAPFHHWLLTAHVEATTHGSILLAGVLLKIPAFAILRLIGALNSIFLNSYVWFLLLVLSSGTIAVCAVRIFFEHDLKRIVALVSITHMNIFITFMIIVGLFNYTSWTVVSIVLLATHSISSAILFSVTGMLSARYHTRTTALISGLLRVYPRLSFYFFISICTACALPISVVFIAEFTIFRLLLSVPEIALFMLILASLSLIFIRFFVLYSSFMGGELPASIAVSTDLTRHEFIMLVAMNSLLFALAFFSSPLLSLIAVGLKSTFFYLHTQPGRAVNKGRTIFFTEKATAVQNISKEKKAEHVFKDYWSFYATIKLFETLKVSSMYHKEKFSINQLGVGPVIPKPILFSKWKSRDDSLDFVRSTRWLDSYVDEKNKNSAFWHRPDAPYVPYDAKTNYVINFFKKYHSATEKKLLKSIKQTRSS